MPFEVHMSQFAEQSVFEQAVDSHIARMSAFNKEMGKPRPVAHPLVEAAIKRVQRPGRADEYVPDYTIVDDTKDPVMPPLTLEQKQQECYVRLVNAENEAKQRILPKMKTRLLSLKYQIAAMKPEDKRTAADNEDVAAYLDMQQRFHAIELTSAKAEAELHDVVEADLATWQPPTFG